MRTRSRGQKPSPEEPELLLLDVSPDVPLLDELPEVPPDEEEVEVVVHTLHTTSQLPVPVPSVQL